MQAVTWQHKLKSPSCSKLSDKTLQVTKLQQAIWQDTSSHQAAASYLTRYFKSLSCSKLVDKTLQVTKLQQAIWQDNHQSCKLHTQIHHTSMKARTVNADAVKCNGLEICEVCDAKAQRDTHQNCCIKQSTVTVQLNVSNAIWFLVQQNDPMFMILHTTLTNNQIHDIKYKLTAIRELPELMTIIANWWQDIFLSVHQYFDGSLLTNAVLSIQTLRQHGVRVVDGIFNMQPFQRKRKKEYEKCVHFLFSGQLALAP